MNKLYLWIDRIWQWVAETVFVRFEFDLPTSELEKGMKDGPLVFTLMHGGIIEWLILSSWCRSKGLGAILIANRKRILALSKPNAFLQVLLGRKTYAELLLSDAPGPRLIFTPNHERKRPFDPVPVERLLADVYSSSTRPVLLVPLLILWRRYIRGEKRPAEYLLGVFSKPNLIGKLWYLFRQRRDSAVRALATFNLLAKDTVENLDQSEESEALRVAKAVRRKLLVLTHQELRVVLGPRYVSPHAVKETLLRDPEIQALIDEIASSQKEDRRKVALLAYKNLTEIVSALQYRTIEVCYVLLTWFFGKVLDGIDTREEDLQKVRETMKSKPLVFVSCHRSHLDYLAIPYALFVHDMVTPFSAAGVNLSFWPVGKILRSGGAFFIRRSFKGDRLYTLCVRKYLELLLRNRFNIKFFIEGTRSRSGKMLPPTYGLLKMFLEAQKKKVVDDIAFVPVSICYDEIPEQGVYSKELAGVPKAEESAGQLLKSRGVFRNKFGKVYLRFADPVSAKDLHTLAESGGLDPDRMLQKAAFQVCKEINDITPITPKSLVSSVLLAHPSPSLSLDEILRASVVLGGYVAKVNAPLTTPDLGSLKRGIEQTVRSLQRTSILSASDNAAPRGYFLDPRKRIILNFYKNNSIHCFVLPSILMLSFLSQLGKPAGDSVINFYEGLTLTAVQLRNLLKFEFFFSPTPVFIREIQRHFALFFGENAWKAKVGPELIGHLDAHSTDWNDLSLYTRILGDLLESLTTAMKFFQTLPRGSYDRKSLLPKVVRFAEGLALEEGIFFPESISIQNYSNVLLLLDNLKLARLSKGKERTTLFDWGGWQEDHRLLKEQADGFLQLAGVDMESLLKQQGFQVSLPHHSSEPTFPL